MENTSRTATVLAIDASANVVAGVGVIAASSLLAAPMGLTATWPLWILGIVLLGYGAENELVRRRPSRRGLAGLIAVDIGFAVAVLAFAIVDPTAAETWMRWSLAVVADASLTMGLLKYWFGLRPTGSGASATA